MQNRDCTYPVSLQRYRPWLIKMQSTTGASLSIMLPQRIISIPNSCHGIFTRVLRRFNQPVWPFAAPLDKPNFPTLALCKVALRWPWYLQKRDPHSIQACKFRNRGLHRQLRPYKVRHLRSFRDLMMILGKATPRSTEILTNFAEIFLCAASRIYCRHME